MAEVGDISTVGELTTDFLVPVVDDPAGHPTNKLIPGSTFAVAAAGSAADPVLIDPVQWLIYGTYMSNEAIDATTFTTDITDIAQDASADWTASLAASILWGGPDAFARGPQIGDRVLLVDNVSYVLQGFYEITSLGAAGQTINDCVTWVDEPNFSLAWRCALEGTAWYATSGVNDVGQNDADQAAIQIQNLSGLCLGFASVAAGRASLVVGEYAEARGYNSIALGYEAVAHTGAVAIGYAAKTMASGDVVVGSVATPARIVKGVHTGETASFTVAVAHLDKYVPCNHATVNIVATIGDTFNNAVPVGSEIRLADSGAADLSVAASGSVALIGTTSATTAGQILWGTKISATTWHFVKLT